MNRIRDNNSVIYYFISVISHVMILLAAVLILDFSSETAVIGDQTAQLIHSYVYKDDTNQNSEMRNNPITKTPSIKKTTVITTKKLLPQAISLEKKSISSKNVSETSMQQSAYSSSRGEQAEELLTVLHAAIQRQQKYPESAMQMERQGRTTMKFTLAPDGNISGLRVSKSSGTESLDNAAFAAVRNAVPFRNIDKYLNISKEFSIDVVFELS